MAKIKKSVRNIISDLDDVPKGLRIWFIIHFIVDMIVAIPLLFFPKYILTVLGFTVVEPFTARIVGAAFLAIGGVSLLMHKKGKEAFDTMLSLKLIWASAAILGIIISLILGAPKIAWLALVAFVIFLFIWIYFKVKIN